MLNKICDLEDQIENLNDLTKKLKEKVMISFFQKINIFYKTKVAIFENRKERFLVKIIIPYIILKESI